MSSIRKRIGDVEKSMTPAQAFKRLLVLQKGNAPIQDQLECLLIESVDASAFKRVLLDLESSVLAATKGTHYSLQRNAVKKAQRTVVFLIYLRDQLDIYIAERGPGSVLSATVALRVHAGLLGPNGPPEEELPRAVRQWQRNTAPVFAQLALTSELVEQLSSQFFEGTDVLPWEIRQLVELGNECLEVVIDSHNRAVELDKELSGAKRIRIPRLHIDKIRRLARESVADESRLMLAAPRAGAYAECDSGRAAEGPIRAFGEQILKICKARQAESDT